MKTKDDEHGANSALVDEKDEKEKSMTIPGLSPVSYFVLFRYASRLDAFLITFAILASVGTGIAFPIMVILFGDVTDNFVFAGHSSESIRNLSCYLTQHPNATFNVTE